jgi:TRAP-type transport system periplasmic protein
MNRVLLACLCLIAAAPARAAEPVTWKLASGYRTESFHVQNLVVFAEEVRKASDGALVLEVHANNSLMKLADIYQGVRTEKVQAGELIMSALPKDVPLAGADSVPFVVDSYAKSQRLWAHQRPLIEKQMAAQGLTPLYAVPWPPQGLYTVRPIASAADLKGAKMRTYNAATVRIAEIVGASGVDVPMVDVGNALAAGKMDSMITSAVTGAENKVWSHLKYYYEINAWYPKNIVFVNSKAFNALPAATQAAVRNAAREAETRGWALSQVAAASSAAELRAHGMKVERPPVGLELDIKLMGERFAREWVRLVGHEANTIFVPYYLDTK